MAQIMIAIIAFVLIKLLTEAYKEQVQNKNNSQPSQKRGEVIDLGNAWIDLDDMPYFRREHLLWGRELAIYHLLQDVLPRNSYVVFPRVRLADAVIVSSEARNRIEHNNRIKERSIDLLVCDSLDLKPFAVIAFKAESEGKKKQLADRFTLKVVEAAGLPSLSLNPSSPPTTTELTAMLRKLDLQI